MIMCVLVCYPFSIHMSQLLSTGHPISSYTSSHSAGRGKDLISIHYVVYAEIIDWFCRESIQQPSDYTQK